LCAFLIFPVCATCPAQLLFLGLITLISSGDKLLLCNISMLLGLPVSDCHYQIFYLCHIF
jgi:hypothetical protein